MIGIIQKIYIKILLPVTIVLFVAYIYMHHYVSFVRVPILAQIYSKSRIRIYCFILTTPKYYDTRARAVNSTWAPRCDRFSFISEYSNDTKGLPIIPIVNLTPGYAHLTQKSTLAFHYIYENFLNDYDWFVKTDDDTYLFVENLRLFLSKQNSSEPITFGYNIREYVSNVFHSGGGGYVLSREAVKRFYQAHQKPNTTCAKDGGGEDVEIAKCLRTAGVYPGKSIDKYNRERFHALSFSSHFIGPIPNWVYAKSENKPLRGSNCCSSTTISFHHVTPEHLYLIDKMHYGFHDERGNYP